MLVLYRVMMMLVSIPVSQAVDRYLFSTRAGAGAGAQLGTRLHFSNQKNPGPVPRSWFRTGPETLLVSNKGTYDVSRRSFLKATV